MCPTIDRGIRPCAARSTTLLALTVLLAVPNVACRSRRVAQREIPVARGPDPSAPVVITLVIDQFAGWIADERLPLLPATGGFARLRREGTWARHVTFAHAVTDTAPGHAALYTGVPPRESGIFANEVVDDAGALRSILRDSDTRVITPDGHQSGTGSSLAKLRVATLADRLREARPGAVIVSLSIKDRAALFGGGRRPTATLWFDPSLDSFVTSTAFGSVFPQWAQPVGDANAIRALRAAPWEMLDPAWVREHAGTPDAQAGEGDLSGFGTTFPHLFTAAQRPAVAFRASPRGDMALFNLAVAALDHARRASEPMLLAISLSSNDYIGHLFGPDSFEAWDELRRLDEAIGRFLSDLDHRFGTDGWSLLLSADHGIVTMPEAAALPGIRARCESATIELRDRPCTASSRLLPEIIAGELDDAARATLGPGHWIRGIADPYVYFTSAAISLPAARWSQLIAAMRARLMAHPEVREVVDPETVSATCANERDDSLPALLCRSIVRGEERSLYVLTNPGGFFDPNYVIGYGTSHGSPYAYDRTVPLLIRAPHRAAAGRVVDAPVSYTEFSVAASLCLGIAPSPADVIAIRSRLLE